jgi:type I restriction enzyme S subunit
MFESISNKCISKPISEICYKPQYGYTASSTIEKVGPKMLRITDIQDGEVIWECVPYCLCSDEDYKKYELKDNDLVFVRIGATTGKSFLIKNPKNSIFASYLIRLNISDKNVLPDYLYLFFQSQKYWQVILKDSRGGIMPNFNAEMLSKLEIPIPNKEIQEELIKKTNILDESINIIQQNITQKLSAISLLSSSLLNEVFGKYEIPEVK